LDFDGQKLGGGRTQGENLIQQRKWPTVRSATKVFHKIETSGLKQRALKNQHQCLLS